MRDMLGMYDKRLAENEYVIGSYSVCDMAVIRYSYSRRQRYRLRRLPERQTLARCD